MYNEGVIQDRFVSNRLDKASMVRATDWQISKRRVQESLTKVSSREDEDRSRIKKRNEIIRHRATE